MERQGQELRLTSVSQCRMILPTREHQQCLEMFLTATTECVCVWGGAVLCY